ncbi:MAG: hypothetical protein AAFQ53_17740 [Bacteroidota bacterium]
MSLASALFFTAPPVLYRTVLVLLVSLLVGCAAGQLITTEEAYAGRSLEGGVLAVQPFSVSVGTSDNDVFVEMLTEMDSTSRVTEPGPAIARLLRETMASNWYEWTYLDSLALVSANDGAGPFRQVPTNPSKPEGMISIPQEGTTLSYDGWTPDYVLLCTGGEVRKENVTVFGPNNQMQRTDEFYVTELAYALWDNQTGRLIQRGELTERAKTSFFTRSKDEEWQRSFEPLIEDLFSKLPLGPVRDGEPLEGEERKANVRAFRI